MLKRSCTILTSVCVLFALGCNGPQSASAEPKHERKIDKTGVSAPPKSQGQPFRNDSEAMNAKKTDTPKTKEQTPIEKQVKRDAPTKSASSTSETPATELIETDGIALARIQIATGVEKRRPVNQGTLFRVGEYERLYAVLEVKNPLSTEDEVTVSWAPLEGGRERGTISVRIGAQKRWRTWAFTRAVRNPGKWEVVVRNSSGETIGRAPFEITAGETSL